MLSNPCITSLLEFRVVRTIARVLAPETIERVTTLPKAAVPAILRQAWPRFRRGSRESESREYPCDLHR